MTVERCSFQTDRLLVRPWHDRGFDVGEPFDLATVVTELMTEAVTRHLPDGWQGPYSIDRARDWIAERDTESPTLLILDRSSGEAVGLVILFEVPADAGGSISIRLGYLMAEGAWGKGLATELLGGLIRWCRAYPEIESIIGGVAQANEASQRALERLGFSLIHAHDREPNDELLYELRLSGGEVGSGDVGPGRVR